MDEEPARSGEVIFLEAGSKDDMTRAVEVGFQRYPPASEYGLAMPRMIMF